MVKNAVNQNIQTIAREETADKPDIEYREISEEELKHILEDHKKWIDSEGKDGEKANLVKANLQKAELFGADLQKADLAFANLQKAELGSANLQKAVLGSADLQEADLGLANLQEAKLDGANLQNANLSNANLQKASLIEANLQEAELGLANLQMAFLTSANFQKAGLDKADMRNTNLDGITGLATANFRYTNFGDATGLLGNEFSHADVTGTKLPDEIKEFKPLHIVEKTSENARKLFFAMLLGCVYSWLTIATTTDVRLLTNTASSPLPIIGTEIPIAWFYITAPLVLICLYFYFHLYLLKLWEGLASLPAIFPDGKRLDERAYPWLLTGLVRRHFRLLRDNRPFIAHVQEWITIFLAWWVVPITMIAFWIRFIPRHDWIGTILHIALITISFAFAVIFYCLCAETLKGEKKSGLRLDGLLMDRRLWRYTSAIVVGVSFSVLSYGSIEGERLMLNRSLQTEAVSNLSVKKLIPLLFAKLGYNVFADFREKSVSEKPNNYWLISKEQQLESVIGANLNKRNLKNADFGQSFLVKADLRNANLQSTIFTYANLQEANLREAILKSANLYQVNLYKANLWGAKLQKAYLVNANLEKATLIDAKLQEAELVSADMQGADMRGAKLQGADLNGTNLKGADLWSADFQNTKLQYANLQGTNIEKAKNLTIEQLSKVKTLYQAKLDPELLEQVKKCCPHLLEKPKKNKT